MANREPIPTLELEIVRGRARERRRPVEAPAFLIGAARDCDLVLAAREFPDVYAYLIVHVDGVVIRYLGVGPDLFVNGRPADEALLVDADRLSAGPYEFVVHMSDQQGDDDPIASAARYLRAGCRTEAEHEPCFDPMSAVFRLVHDVRHWLSTRPELVRRPA